MRGFEYLDEGWPIFTPAAARAANHNYFKHLTSTQPGISKAILGHVVVDQATRSSYMIVRRSQRTPYIAQHMQTVAGGYERAPRAVYKASQSDYVIVRQVWADGAVYELHTFDTAPAARASFQLITNRGFMDYITE